MAFNTKLFGKICRANTITHLMQKSELSTLIFGKRQRILERTGSLRKSRSYSSHLLHNPLYDIPFVQIPKDGEFNYMLLLAYNHGESGLGRLIVRGDRTSHEEIVKGAREEVHAKQLCLKPKGGGQMCHDPDKKAISIFGKSKEYGKADRDDVKEVLLKTYRKYKITKA